MKAERRHELQTNALADWLAKTIQKVQPHANTILIGTLLVVGGIVAVVMLSGRSNQRSAGAWGEYYQATLIEDVDKRIAELSGVAEAHPETAPGLWARLMVAEARLVRGANASFKDREAGLEDLDKAQADFETVIKGGAALSDSEAELLMQRAHWGLARTFESLAEGDNATEEYAKLAKAWPESALGKAAAKKADQLRAMSDWYDWYASVDPTKIEPSATRQGFPGGGFPTGGGNTGGFDHGFPIGNPPPENELPDDPNFNLPDPLGLPGVDDLDLDLGPGTDPADPGDTDAGSTEPSDASTGETGTVGEGTLPSDEQPDTDAGSESEDAQP